MDKQESRLRLNSDAILRYSGYLEVAEEFLSANYGLTIESAQAMRFGVCIDPFPQHRMWEGRLIIPYLDAAGNPYALKARAMDGDQPKYLGDEGVEPSLYNVQALLSDADTLWVTEGEMDAAVLAQELGLCAVGYAGTGNWREHFTRAVGPDWDRIVVLADGDEAGRGAARKVAKDLRADVINLPDGEDVSSLHTKRGKRGLRLVLGIETEEAV